MTEDELVPAIIAAARAGGAALSSPLAPLGPGDDAAVLRPPGEHDLVWTVDDQVEAVHFVRGWGLDAVGRKAIGAALSDLAAMGATPLGALLALQLPADLLADRDGAAVLELARGAGEALAACGCPLLGGNVVRHPERLGLSVSALGHLPRGQALRRDAARPGDDLFVVGPLGLARVGLGWLLRGGARTGMATTTGTTAATAAAPGVALAVDALLRPRPRLAEGAALRGLAAAGARVACMDLSDGLARDLPRLLRASGAAAELDDGALPAPAAALLAAAGHAEAPQAAAWLGGEDYALLVAGPPDLPARVALPELARIGRVVAGPPGAVHLPGSLAGLGGGFDHLTRPST